MGVALKAVELTMCRGVTQERPPAVNVSPGAVQGSDHGVHKVATATADGIEHTHAVEPIPGIWDFLLIDDDQSEDGGYYSS